MKNGIATTFILIFTLLSFFSFGQNFSCLYEREGLPGLHDITLNDDNLTISHQGGMGGYVKISGLNLVENHDNVKIKAYESSELEGFEMRIIQYNGMPESVVIRFEEGNDPIVYTIYRR